MTKFHLAGGSKIFYCFCNFGQFLFTVNSRLKAATFFPRFQPCGLYDEAAYLCIFPTNARGARAERSETGGIVFDAQALLKNQKMALLVFLRGSFLGVIGTLLFSEIWCFLKMKISFLLY